MRLLQLFGRGLTHDQKAELKTFSAKGNELSSRCREAFETLRTEVSGLYAKCRDSRTAGTSLVSVDALVEGARNAMNAYRSQLESARTGLLSAAPADWYPKRLRKGYQSLIENLDASLRFAAMVQEALEPPPLTRQPDQDKLNMFVGGLDLVAALQKGQKFPKQ